MQVEVFGSKPQISEATGRVLFSKEIPLRAKPLTPEEITAGMQTLSNIFDIHQRRAEALRKG